jgi:hypothetical protein
VVPACTLYLAYLPHAQCSHVVFRRRSHLCDARTRSKIFSDETAGVESNEVEVTTSREGESGSPQIMEMDR